MSTRSEKIDCGAGPILAYERGKLAEDRRAVYVN
jgi:hypothetical protein